MAVSTFDPNVFLSQEIKGANDTKFTPFPKGEWNCFVKELGMDEYEGKPILIVTWSCLDDEVKKTMGVEAPTIQDRIFLDYENGVLQFGMNKNIKLGRLREAVGQNDAKQKWNFNMLNGAGPVKLMVDHVPGKGEQAGETFARITRYAKGK
jgi:hypothetical protein